MRFGQHYIWYLIALFILVIHPARANDKVVQLAVSSAIHDPFIILCNRFNQKTDFGCKIHSAPTGHLYAQIMHGMSFDIFISTQQNYTQGLIYAAKADPHNRLLLATARIVLWSADSNATPDSLYQLLTQSHEGAIAMPNPGITPYGVAAKEILQEHHVWRTMQDRLIFGHNLRHTYEMIANHQIPLGFISMAQLSNEERLGHHYWEPDPKIYKPVLHEAILLKPTHPQESSLAFMAYLQTQEAREILEDAGFDCPISNSTLSG